MLFRQLFLHTYIRRKKLPKWRSYKKCAGLTLMKLTPVRLLKKWDKKVIFLKVSPQFFPSKKVLDYLKHNKVVQKNWNHVRQAFDITSCSRSYKILFSLLSKNFFVFVAKLGHFTISDFFPMCNKTLKLNSENRKTKKKSFIGSATDVMPAQIWSRFFHIQSLSRI